MEANCAQYVISQQDYHVILVYRHMSSKQSWVYDLDTRLDFPCCFKRYAEETIGDDDMLQPEYQRLVQEVMHLLVNKPVNVINLPSDYASKITFLHCRVYDVSIYIWTVHFVQCYLSVSFHLLFNFFLLFKLL
jgi:N-terminal glutamine amidase